MGVIAASNELGETTMCQTAPTDVSVTKCLTEGSASIFITL